MLIRRHRGPRPTHGLCTASLVAFSAVLAFAPTARAERRVFDVPESFPRFDVPGHDKEMTLLRELFWEHYERGGPLATLWDEWLSMSTLWPAVEKDNRMETIRRRWHDALAGRYIDPEGYVATHQHPSIAHQRGWPFPFWAQGGAGAWGWHFSLADVPAGWHGTKEKTQEGWTLTNGTDDGIADAAWNLALSAPQTAVQTPPLSIDVLQSPFLQLRWRAQGLGAAQPCVEWTTADAREFAPERRMYFDAIESTKVVYTMIPVYRHPKWTGRITGLRVQFDNPAAGGRVGIQALFTQYDTRHNINNPNFIRGCANYVEWTHDLSFLRDQIERMRLAMRWLMHDCRGLDERCIIAPFVGHCGRSGLKRDADGTKHVVPGLGIGNNYWDLLPAGYRDAYATMQYYDTLRVMAALERAIAAHPEWNVPAGSLALDPDELERHAADVKAANSQFWDAKTQRFTLGLDVDGRQHDYGYTFMNLEAIDYDYATPQQADAILRWITGERTVAGDTSTGADIYHWRFAPRASTRRNIDWYGWFWSGPEAIPWGGQVQDGGAVLGFSYHDLMARLKRRGPDDAWARLREIIAWFNDIQEAGGYRPYYADGTRGTLQGGGTAGGLGADREFYESILVPQVMLYGLAGFAIDVDGFRVEPRLPKDWPALTIDRIRLCDRVLTLHVTPKQIEVRFTGRATEPWRATFPPGPWRVERLDADGKVTRTTDVPTGDQPCVQELEATTSGIRLTRP